MTITIKDGAKINEITADEKFLNELAFLLDYAEEKLSEYKMKGIRERAEEIKTQIYKQLKESGYYNK